MILRPSGERVFWEKIKTAEPSGPKDPSNFGPDRFLTEENERADRWANDDDQPTVHFLFADRQICENAEKRKIQVQVNPLKWMTPKTFQEDQNLEQTVGHFIHRQPKSD